MRTRNPRVKRQIEKAKGDILSQKWMTNLLAFILILLIVAFVVLSIPSVKNYIVDFVRVLRFGKEKEPERPQINHYNPFNLFEFALRGYLYAYQMHTQ